MELKTPKGTVDSNTEDMLLYESLIDKVKSIYKLHGAVPIDTPIFELKSILLNKYGEDTKLIYDLKNNGGEECALRYDLTIPFSRYMSMNKLKKIKRYQIGKVYRRDQPSIKQGRLREFIQADFDIAGEGLPMMIDSELICCMDRVLTSFEIGDFIIRLSDKRILFSIFETCNIPKSSYGIVSSCIDKLDKISLKEVNLELSDKGLSADQIFNLNKYITMNGREDIIDFLLTDKIFKNCSNAIKDLQLLYKYCQILNCSKNILIDLSLARGLEYYTGLILEGRYIGKDVGSVAGGGRYDELIGSFGKASNSKIPCAGFSIGLSRVFNLVKNRKVENSVDVFISSSCKLFIEERLKIQTLLWSKNISLETFYNKRINVADHKKYCLKKGIKNLIVFGEQEFTRNCVTLINIEDDTKEEVLIDQLTSVINLRKNKNFSLYLLSLIFLWGSLNNRMIFFILS